MYMFAIWIGNRLPQGINLNTLDIQYYLTNGSCCIQEMDHLIELPTEVNRLFKKYGGTVLKFSREYGMNIHSFKTHGTSNHEEISGSYLAGSVEYLDRSVARVKYKHPEKQEAHCSRVLMADCTFMITYNFDISVSTKLLLKHLQQEMISYLTHNQIVKFIPPQPILKQAEVEQEYIRDVSSPTVINLPSIPNRSSSNSSSSGSLIDIGDIAGGLVGAGISAGLTGLLG